MGLDPERQASGPSRGPSWSARAPWETLSKACPCALSADGNTAIVGGSRDNSNAGAAWVWTRSGGVWTQQGHKLVGTGAVGSAQQGMSVSLSADGNTAIVGGMPTTATLGPRGSGPGAAASGPSRDPSWSARAPLGRRAARLSVSLSADGNTAIVGGHLTTTLTPGPRGSGRGAEASGPSRATKLVGPARGGRSARLVGRPVRRRQHRHRGGRGDNNCTGAVWVLTRSGSVWTQQGAKLVGTAPAGAAHKARPLRCPPRGNTAIVGRPQDSNGTGAAWVFTRSGGVWTQQGAKLVGSGAVGIAEQGTSAALSGDGSLLGPGAGAPCPHPHGPGARGAVRAPMAVLPLPDSDTERALLSGPCRTLWDPAESSTGLLVQIHTAPTLLLSPGPPTLAGSRRTRGKRTSL